MSSAEQTSTATIDPVATDQELSRIYGEMARVEASITQRERALERHALLPATSQKYGDEVADMRLTMSRLHAEAAPHEELYRQHRWSRAFLVNNPNGHVHRNMSCSTCFPTTSYLWITELSGSTEEEIIEAAAERACTVCYPDAPVETRSRPSRLRSDEETARAEREAVREQCRREQSAKELIDPETGELVRDSDGRTLRTERAALNEASRCLQDLAVYNHYYDLSDPERASDHPMTPQWRAAVFRIAASLAAKQDADYDAVMLDLATRALKSSTIREFAKQYGKIDVARLYELLG